MRPRPAVGDRAITQNHLERHNEYANQEDVAISE